MLTKQWHPQISLTEVTVMSSWGGHLNVGALLLPLCRSVGCNCNSAARSCLTLGLRYSNLIQSETVKLSCLRIVDVKLKNQRRKTKEKKRKFSRGKKNAFPCTHSKTKKSCRDVCCFQLGSCKTIFHICYSLQLHKIIIKALALRDEINPINNVFVNISYMLFG